MHSDIAVLPQHAEHVTRGMNLVANPCDRSTHKRWMRSRPSHDVKKASKGHDPVASTDLALIGESCWINRRFASEPHTADLVERATHKSSAERQIARLVTERNLIK
jgi:hypothetical protein